MANTAKQAAPVSAPVSAVVAVVANFRAYEKDCDIATQSRKVFALSMSRVFVLGMSYDAYAAQALEFRKEYGSTPEASQKAFERALKEMNSYLRTIDAAEFSIPKSEKKAAVKVAESRKVAQEKAAVIIAKAAGKPTEQTTAADLAKVVQLHAGSAEANIRAALISEWNKKANAEKAEKDKAAKEANTKLLDECIAMVKAAKLDAVKLAKIKAALLKIK